MRAASFDEGFAFPLDRKCRNTIWNDASSAMKVAMVSLVLMIPNAHPHHSAISFHVRSIVQRSAVLKYLADRWSSLFRKPSFVVRAFGKNISTQAEVRALLEEERVALDELHKGKNNWNSIFVSGLLDPIVLAWLAGRFSIPGRASDSPLG